MAPSELTVEQCRTLARLRARRPDALVSLHAAGRDVVVELRRGRRSELARLDSDGRLIADRPLIPRRPR